MADLYIADSTYAAYVSEYGDEAKAEMRSILKAEAPTGDADE